MKLNKTVRSKLRRLIDTRKEIEKLELVKERAVNFFRATEQKYGLGAISYYEYKKRISFLEGQTLETFLKKINKEIEKLKKEIQVLTEEIYALRREEQEKRKKKVRKSFRLASIFFVIFFIFFVLFFFRPEKAKLTGFLIGTKEKTYQDNLLLEFNASQEYEWHPKNYGQLTSLKVSGKLTLIGQRSVKIYFQDKLILDSSKLKKQEKGISQVSRNLITGLAVEDDSEGKSNEGESGSDVTITEANVLDESSETTESTGENPSEPVQQPEEQLTEEPIEETTTEEFTEPASETEENQLDDIINNIIEENITEENVSEENLTEENTTEQNITEEIITYEIDFSQICIETCDLRDLNLTNTNYILRIEIQDAFLELNSITYTIKPIEIENITEENISEENITLIPFENYRKIQDDPLFDVIVESAFINGSNLNVNFYHDSEKNQKISIETNESLDYELSKKVSNKDEIVSLEVFGYNNKYFELWVGNETEIIAFGEKENITEVNVTENFTEETIQYDATIGMPVKWLKKIFVNASLEEPKEIKIKLPKESSNISIKKIEKKEKLKEDKFNLTEGEEILDEISATSPEYENTYETPAPELFENQINEKQKEITIKGPENLHYQNILAFTSIQEIQKEKIKLYLLNETQEQVNLTYIDENNNSLIDKIEWFVPDLIGKQKYLLVIEISKAEHLDENRSFISDIYEQVYQLDDIWSEEIPSGHYARVTFRKNLTSNNDITIFPRIVSGEPKIEVYEVNGTEKIAEFSNLKENEYNKILLTNLKGKQ
ncbi:MAG: hypothetical protein QW412_03295, partial [Candidatus Aenigmatarchaeota archaeon]